MFKEILGFLQFLSHVHGVLAEVNEKEHECQKKVVKVLLQNLSATMLIYACLSLDIKHKQCFLNNYICSKFFEKFMRVEQ